MNTKKIVTQLKREIWENKVGFLWAPVIVTALLAALLLVGTVNYKDVNILSSDGEFNVFMNADSDESTSANGSVDSEYKEVEIKTSKDHPLNLSSIIKENPDILTKLVYGSLLANTVLLCTVFFIVLLSYAHGCLFDDRKNREVLFWRSMPVSETMNVLVKLAMTIFTAPVVILFLNVVISMIVIVVGGIAFLSVGGSLSGVISAATDTQFISGLAQFFFGTIKVLLMLLPLISFIFLSSSIAKKSPFFTSSVIPIVLIIADKIFNSVLGINLHVITLLRSYAEALKRVLPKDLAEGTAEANSIVVYAVILLISAVFIVATIWVRNNRYEI